MSARIVFTSLFAASVLLLLAAPRSEASSNLFCTAAIDAASDGIAHAQTSGANLTSCSHEADVHEQVMLGTWPATDAATLGDIFEDACVDSLQGTPEEHIETQIIALYCGI